MEPVWPTAYITVVLDNLKCDHAVPTHVHTVVVTVINAQTHVMVLAPFAFAFWAISVVDNFHEDASVRLLQGVNHWEAELKGQRISKLQRCWLTRVAVTPAMECTNEWDKTGRTKLLPVSASRRSRDIGPVTALIQTSV